MNEIGANTKTMPASNQRSVIAKSICNQIVPASVFANTELCDSNESYEPASPPTIVYRSYSPSPGCDHLSSSPLEPDHIQLGYISGSSCSATMIDRHHHHSSSYDYCCSSHELMKSKRKPIPVPSESKDDAYWERRRRNNESAKRSREIRRIKEMQTNKRIVYLEQENVKLQAEISFLREEIKRLRENEFLPYLVRRTK